MVRDERQREAHSGFFMEIITLTCYNIWTIRNDAIFGGILVWYLRCLEIFRRSFGELLWRVKKKYFPAIELWLEQVV